MNRKVWALFLALVILALSGCQAGEDRSVSVTSVAEICGLGPVGWVDSFSGVVSARSEVEIRKDPQKTVAEIHVKQGDAVTEGDVLFTYEQGQAELQLQRAKLELQQLQYTLQAHKEKKLELEKLKAKAKEDQQLSYTVEIAETDALIRETEYNIINKETDIEALSLSMENLDVLSPVTGIVQTLNENGGMDNYGNEKPFMVLTETGNRRIKAYVNETHLSSVMPGMEMTVCSRVNEDTWLGIVSHIDFEASESTGENYYMGAVDDTMTSSKYPFYMDLETDEGLALGQHVYVMPKVSSQEEGEEKILLPSYYLVTDGEENFVWAMNANSRLEKRAVETGAEDPMMGTVEILSGLSREDCLAFPEEDLRAGLPCIEGGFASEEDAGSVADEEADFVGDDLAVIAPDDMK